jgi:YD repeat-containing protein
MSADTKGYECYVHGQRRVRERASARSAASHALQNGLIGFNGSNGLLQGSPHAFVHSHLDSRLSFGNLGVAAEYTSALRLRASSYDLGGKAARAYPGSATHNCKEESFHRNTQNGLPTSVSNGTFINTRAFSGYGEIDGTSTTVNGANVAGYNITSRDQAGRITQKVETVGGVQNTFDYMYDDNGRLREVKKNGTTAEAYTYDDNNNRLTEVNTFRGINRSYAVSDEDHLITAGSDSYQFDVDGFLMNKTSSGSTTGYQYSSRGELLSATLPNGNVITYDNDPMGRRITKRINGVISEKYLWQNNTKLLAVYDASDNLISRFTYANERMPVSMAYNGSTFYLTYDQVGSLRAVADVTGNIVKKIDYDSFGNIITDTNPSMTVPLGFAGGLHNGKMDR